MTERIRRERPAPNLTPASSGSENRVRRSRPEKSAECREYPEPIENIRIKWIDYKGDKILYVGSHYFGHVGRAHSSHLGTRARFVGNVQIPGCVGPVSYGDTVAAVMRDVKNKAMEWLEGLTKEPPERTEEKPKPRLAR